MPWLVDPERMAKRAKHNDDDKRQLMALLGDVLTFGMTKVIEEAVEKLEAERDETDVRLIKPYLRRQGVTHALACTQTILVGVLRAVECRYELVAWEELAAAPSEETTE